MVSFIKRGQGYPIVLLPGWPSNFTEKTLLIKDLAANYQVFALNLPGFGYTDPLPNQPTLENLVAFLDKFIKDQKLNKFHLLGASFGGMLAAKYASTHNQKINKLVLIAPPVSFSGLPNRLKNAYRILFWFYDKYPGLINLLQNVINSDRLFPKLYYLFTKYNYTDNLDDYNQNKNDIRNMNIHECLKMFRIFKNLDIRDNCKKITAQTLILTGTKDSFVGESPKVLKDIVPNSDLIELNAEHWGILEAFTTEKLLKFLET